MATTAQPLRTRTFVWTVDHSRNNKTGWKPVGTSDNFYPGPGYMVAHDTIEHFGNSESWERELIAFGATMYGRMHESPEDTEVSAFDLANFMIYDQKGVIPKTKVQYYKNKLPGETEEFLQFYMGCVRHRLDNIKDPLVAFINGMPTPERLGITDYQIEESLHNAEAWLRRGWLMAQRLFHKHSFEEMCELFDKVRNAVDNMTDKLHPKVGDKITVSINRADNTFSIHTA